MSIEPDVNNITGTISIKNLSIDGNVYDNTNSIVTCSKSQSDLVHSDDDFYDAKEDDELDSFSRQGEVMEVRNSLQLDSFNLVHDQLLTFEKEVAEEINMGSLGEKEVPCTVDTLNSNVVRYNNCKAMGEKDLKIVYEDVKHTMDNDDLGKFIVRNKDTGEVYDIRELETSSMTTYNLFPQNFTAEKTNNDIFLSDSEGSIEIRDAEQTSDNEHGESQSDDGVTRQQTEFESEYNENSVPEQKKEKTKKTRRRSLTKQLKMLSFPLKNKNKNIVNSNHISVLTKNKEKGRCDFESLSLRHSVSRHTGTIWTLKFSYDGARLASGGQDTILRIWKVSLHSAGDDTVQSPDAGTRSVIEELPEREYEGHTLAIVDISWSRSNFILSASMDKTVRLWHISRGDCLFVFQHPDSVPAVDFHPKEDRFFLSGCFDNKARIWDIPEGSVVSFVQTSVMITAATFNPSGSRVIVGLLNGQCIFYQVNPQHQMNYYTQIECRNAHGPLKRGRKVTGIEFDPEGKCFLVSTNDSRMRLYSVDNYSRLCKYKGLVNDHLQIKGRFSQDGDYVICGSENGDVYIWKKTSSIIPRALMKRRLKEDRNSKFERFSAADPPNGIVTVALFAPASTYAMVKTQLSDIIGNHSNSCTGLIVTATYNGSIKFFERVRIIEDQRI